MRMKRVFISYSRHNLDAVMQLIHDLKAVGVDTWHDQTLTGGQRWWDNILTNIRECDIFIFALSPESWESEACKSELGYVEQLRKPILPVLISDGININLLPHPLNEIQVADCRSGDREAVFALVKSIYSTPPAPDLPDPLPDAPPVPISYLSNLNDRIETTEPLTSQDQITLLFELEEELREGRSPTEIRDLLLRLKRRDDLLAKISTKIDAALESLDAKTTGHSQGKKAPAVSDIVRQNREGSDSRPASESKLCPQCHAKYEPGSKFCGNCGAALAGKGGANPSLQEDKVPTVEGSKSRRYACPPDENPQLIADVRSWLDSQNFETQQMSTDDEGVLLQIKKRGGWRDFVGMATSLNIMFHQADDTLVVQVGAGKWVDKAAVGTVSLLFLWPLAITAGFGVWEQMKLPDKIFDYIGTRLISR
jgi:hypothetical protein